MVNIYIASGTADFLQNVKENNNNEALLLLHGKTKSILVHESEKKSIFALPQSFEIEETYGQMNEEGLYAFHYLSVESSRRDIVIEQLARYGMELRNEPSLKSYRILKPLKRGEHILFITGWGGSASYEAWTKSSKYKEQFASIMHAEPSSVQKIFDGESFVVTYSPTPSAKEEE